MARPSPIKTLRLLEGLTLQDVANRSGLDIAQLAKFENAKLPLSDTSLGRIMRALEATE